MPTKKARLTLQKSLEEHEFISAIQVDDASLIGHSADFSIVVEADVKDGRAVNAEKVLFNKQLVLDGHETRVAVPRNQLRAYSFKGSKIDLKLHTRLKVDDAIFFDTTVTEEQELALGLKPPLTTDAKALVEPKDVFSFFSNLQAIPAHRKMITLALLVVGGIVALVNLLIGAHDQFVADSATYFYSHFNSDGESQSPLAGAFAGSGVLGAGVWYLVRRQLRRYMSFELARLPDRITYGDVLKAGDLFTGKSRVPLENVTLRIVACNLEKGQYKRGSGTNVRTVSFSEPVRAVIVYERNVSQIPAGVPIQNYFKQHLTFDLMFELLYPPLEVSKSHGLGVHWEVQLLHPQFVDQELVGPSSVFSYDDFLR